MEQPLGATISTQISPFSRLPYDILYEIFLIAWNLTVNEDHKLDFQTIASHVCRSWRAAAVHSSILWSDIVFDHRPPFDRQILWIKRSGEAALSITIASNYGVKQMGHLLRILRPTVARWRSLKFSPTTHLKAKSFRLFFDELRDEAAPMLVNVWAVNGGRHCGWRFRPFSGGAPNLSRLQISNYKLHGNTNLFGNLTSLEITDMPDHSQPSSITNHDIFAILAECAGSLEILKVELPDCVPLDATIQSPTILYRLRTLSLPPPKLPRAILPHPWVVEIYTGVLAPQVLYHHFDPITLYEIHTAFPFPGLLHLDISQEDTIPTLMGIPEATFTAVLSQVPQLQTFTVRHIHYVNYGVLASLCPQLQQLTILGAAPTWSRHDKLRISGLKDVVEARQLRASMQGTTDTLQSIKLERLGMPDDEVEWLQDHVESFDFRRRYWNRV